VFIKCTCSHGCNLIFSSIYFFVFLYLFTVSGLKGDSQQFWRQRIWIVFFSPFEIILFPRSLALFDLSKADVEADHGHGVEIYGVAWVGLTYSMAWLGGMTLPGVGLAWHCMRSSSGMLCSMQQDWVLFDPWIRDPGWTTRIIFFKSLETIFLLFWG
jgi:hypothetical protein